MSKSCQVCGKRAYSDFCMQHKPRKQITKKGRKTTAYETWRDTIAIPYLDKTFGRVCAACGGERCHNRQLDVDHIKKRGMGGAPSRTMDLNNVQYLGRFPCHFEKDNTAKGIINAKATEEN